MFDNILATYASEQKERTIDTKDERDLQFKVSVVPFESQGSNIRGIGRAYVNDNFVVNKVSVLQDEQGKAIYRDICYPVTNEFCEVIYGEMVDSFKVAKDKTVSKGNDDFMEPDDTEFPIMYQGQDKIGRLFRLKRSIPTRKNSKYILDGLPRGNKYKNS